MRKLLALIVLVLVAWGGYSYFVGSGSVGGDDVIKLGYIGPLTGNAAAYGQDTKRAIEKYFADNPSINGIPVEVIYEDSDCNGQKAASAATKLINVDGVKFILGGQCSGETLGAAAVAEENKVLLFSPISSSPEITGAGDYVFRIGISDKIMGRRAAEEIIEQDFTKVAILTESTDYATAWREVFVHRVDEVDDVSIAVDEFYQPDTTDFKTLLTKVKDSGADVLVSVSQTAPGHGFTVKQARELGLDIQIYGTDTTESPQFVEIAKDAAEGVRMVNLSADRRRAEVDEYLNSFGAVESAEVFVLMAHDSAKVLAEAIGAVGNDADAVKDYFYGLAPFLGLSGDIAFDENGDNNVQQPAVKEVQDGEFDLIR
jgi:branched-chain amino acid transport system substrate-binding protein